MKITEIDSIHKYVHGSFIIPIGIGTTAVCYLMRNKHLLKIYLNTYNKKVLFGRFEDIINHFETLNHIQNDTYIAPDEILIKNGQLVGYTYPYIEGKTLKKEKKLILSSLIEKYDKLVDDTEKISNYNLTISDLHDRNIIIGDNIYLIDMDRYFIDQDNTNVFSDNMHKINKTLLYNIFDKHLLKKIIQFHNEELNNLYNESLNGEFNYIKDLIVKLEEMGINTKTDIRRNEKKLIKVMDNDYYHGFN